MTTTTSNPWLPLMLLTLLVVVALMTLGLALVAWRRFDRRQRLAKPNPSPDDDLWKLSGQRLIARMTKTTRSPPRDPPSSDSS